MASSVSSGGKQQPMASYSYWSQTVREPSPVPPQALDELRAFIDTLSTSITEADLMHDMVMQVNNPLYGYGAPSSLSQADSQEVPMMSDSPMMLDQLPPPLLMRSPSPTIAMGQWIGSIPLEDFMPHVSEDFDVSISSSTSASDAGESLSDHVGGPHMSLGAYRQHMAGLQQQGSNNSNTAILDNMGDIMEEDDDQDEDDQTASISTESAEEGIYNGQFPPSDDEDPLDADIDGNYLLTAGLEELHLNGGSYSPIDQSGHPKSYFRRGPRQTEAHILAGGPSPRRAGPGHGFQQSEQNSELNFPHLIEDLVRSGRDPFSDIIKIEEVDEHQLILRLKNMKPHQVSIQVENRDLLISGHSVLEETSDLSSGGPGPQRIRKPMGEMLFERRFRFPANWDKIHMTASEDDDLGGLIVKITRVTLKHKNLGFQQYGGSLGPRRSAPTSRLARLRRMTSMAENSPPSQRRGGPGPAPQHPPSGLIYGVRGPLAGRTGKSVTILEQPTPKEEEEDQYVTTDDQKTEDEDTLNEADQDEEEEDVVIKVDDDELDADLLAMIGDEDLQLPKSKTPIKREYLI